MSHVLESQNADERATSAGYRHGDTGTKEWAASTLNVASGCGHGCLYCYARFNALRYGQIKTGAEWACETVHADRVAKGYHGGRGRIMMPSSHDITPVTVDAVAEVACKLLDAPTPKGRPETTLLLVTKGDGPCVEQICRAMDELDARKTFTADYGYHGVRRRVIWRLTIGCLDDRCRQFWEPGAPDIDMRLETLRWLFHNGWQTSVSCEPLLEPRRAAELVATVASFVTETIWIGSARELRARTAWCRSQTNPAYTPAGMRVLENAIANIEVWQTPSAILRVAESIRKVLLDWPPGPGEAWRSVWQKLRWKDSYAHVLRQHGWKIEHGRLVASSQEPVAGQETAGSHAEAAENAEEN